ncbi:MAG: DUF3536 domain-containing protein, partial [Candidatus Humimicrobiaceae bacterium]
MDKYICIHGHFYQPPRENPWLEMVELQDSAKPYHDWNEKITSECYAPNTASRIIDDDGKIIDIANNYKEISFNFGPTLLSWLKANKGGVYKAIINADKESREIFSGHGSAIAQCYNHMIMPLANSRDKRTQVFWGIKDFEKHFGRYPEGMWLPETAVDLETLDYLAEFGIKFTILAPSQARRIKKIGEENWTEVDGSKIDPKMPYLIDLPSGKNLNIFFYDGPISNDVGFGNLLGDGQEFAKRLVSAFGEDDKPQLVHIATDGETYGHHHRFGDMALSYCMHYLESKNLAKITNYGQYLEKFPPTHQAEIHENSSWSCAHGIERWRSDCGCNTGMHKDWNQKWRDPLRKAMDWLRDEAKNVYTQQIEDYFNDPWAARDNYIEVIFDRSKPNVENFLAENQKRDLSPEEKIHALKLLEIQRHSMLIFTSCGWFFDEISGIETVQVLMYAARLIQLVKDVSGKDLEPGLLDLLEGAPSNIKTFQNGRNIYKKLVKPAILDLLRVGINFAVSSIFENYPEHTKIYCFEINTHIYERIKLGRQKLAIGKSSLHSTITWEEEIVKFAILHLGDHNLVGGIKSYENKESFEKTHREIKDAFLSSDIPLTITLMDEYFGSHNYSLWHLFKDKQREIILKVAKPAIKEIEQLYRQIYNHNYPIMQAMKQMEAPLPDAFVNTIKFIFDSDLIKIIRDRKTKLKKLKNLVEEINRWPIQPDKKTIAYEASKNINRLMEKLY